MFINRASELKFLNKKYSEKGFQFLVIYGRRRTGKTELIKQFSENKNGIYYIADKRGTLLNAKLFAREAALFFNDVEPLVENFDGVFDYIAKRAGNKRIIITIDEFSYLVEKDDSVPSVFQKISDNILKNTNMTLILCGSSIGMMERGVLNYKSPLYGRRTGEWKLNPMKYKDALGFFPKYSFEDKVKAVLVLGGIPAYLRVFDDSLGIFGNIENKVLAKGEFLYDEVNRILQEELRDPATYLRILDSMSRGASKTVDIANKSYLDAKDIPKYLNVLQKLEYVRKIHPITEKKPKSKKTTYKISDNFFRFWFNFVSAYKNDLELGKTNLVIERIKKDFDSFLGILFENFCEQLLPELDLPIKLEKIGTWWGHCREKEKRKELDIDLVGVNEKTKEILFIECKWSELKEKEAREILEKLKDKARFVNWNSKKEYFGLIGKKIKEKEKLKKDGLVVFDLADLEKTCK